MKKSDPQEIHKFLGELVEFIILKGMIYRFTQKDGVIDTIVISGYVDVEELNRPNLFKVWDALASTGNYALNKINSKFMPGSTPTSVSDTSDKGMYG